MNSLSELRRHSRESLQGNWSKAVVVTLLYLFFCYFLPQLIELAMDGISLIYLILTTGAFQVGFSLFLLNLIRGREFSEMDLFSFFQSGRSFLRSFVYQVLCFIYLFLWTLLLIIPGIIKSYSYALARYILIDHTDISPNDAITKSRELMDGNKMELFLLQLSFVGWFILSLLTLGIGLIWLVPYYMAAEAKFYEEVRKSREASSGDVVEQ